MADIDVRAEARVVGMAVGDHRARNRSPRVDVKVAGLHPKQYYWLWVTGDDGHRIGAGTFTGVSRPAEFRLMAAVPLSEARRDDWVCP